MDDLVQSQPYMPPISAKNIFLFGDLTITFEDDLRRLLHVKSNATLQSFFGRVSHALRTEIQRLPRQEQAWFPHFTNLIDLVAGLEGSEGTPVLRFALLCVYQVGRFIHCSTEGSMPYPRPDNTHLLGLCTGCFAAAAISASWTVASLLAAGVEAVRVAFRAALRSMQHQCNIEKASEDIPRSWSVIAGLPEADAAKLIEEIIASECLPSASRPYISATSATNTTISGPPSVLKRLTEHTSVRVHIISVESPYHAAHLYNDVDVEEVLGTLSDPAIAEYKQRIPILSPSTGEVIAGKNLRSLLQQAVVDTLRLRIDWNKILAACAQFGSADQLQETQDYTIWPVASSAAPMLYAKLGSSEKMRVSVRNQLNVLVNGAQPDAPSHRFADSKIAIVGFSGRFPEAASNDEFWELLCQGRDTHRTIPPDRFDWEAHFDETGKKKNTSRVKYGCFINDPGVFDARFFNLSPREAENTDPAQRLALTTAYEALEMSGFVPDRTPSSQRDRVGVFYGVTSDDWREVNSGQDVDTYFIPGGNRAFVPGRISYFFRLCGPSISVDTACSSSFAAIQTACSYLSLGHCDTAIAGGTNVITNPDNFAGLDRGHFLSTTGNCNPFDDFASGYCRADAVGSVVLKRLEDAQADNDPIFAVIAGANTNHCGQTVSITRPHEGDQLSLFKRILRHSNTNPMDVSYIEMHGTGTQAGDAAEMQSVLKAFVPKYDRKPYHSLHIGGVKANIGHSESASGVSALIKVLKMMEHNSIPPHVGIKNKINHNYPLDLAERNVHIALKQTPWRKEDMPSGKRVCFLNNFSAAGGNTAVLLEDAPIATGTAGVGDERTMHVVAVTAKNTKSLENNIAKLVTHLESGRVTSLPALSYTTTARRQHHKFRVMVAGANVSSITDALQRQVPATVKAIPAKAVKVAWAFTGQGSLYAGIGRRFFHAFSRFRLDLQDFDRIAQLQGFPGFLELAVHSSNPFDAQAVDTVSAHLALLCIQMALCRLWTSWGVRPDLVTGHSLGEYAALYAAGVLSASDAIYLVGTRARLLNVHCTKNTHSMLAIKASEEVTLSLIGNTTCQIACVNSPNSTVVGGPKDDIDNLYKSCQSQKYACTVLSIPYAFHSAQVDPILEEFKRVARGVIFNTPMMPYLSPLLAKTVTGSGVLNAAYLSAACRGVVDFCGALRSSHVDGLAGKDTVWLEFGSHPACLGMVKDTFGSQTVALATLRKDSDAWKSLSETASELYLRGIDLKWDEYHRDFPDCTNVLTLPSYQWDLKNYWIPYRNNHTLTKGDAMVPAGAVSISTMTPVVSEQRPYISSSVHRILEEQHGANGSVLLAETNIRDPCLDFIVQGHRVNGVPLCSSSLYADMAMTIVRHMLNSASLWNDGTGLDCCHMRIDKTLIANMNTSVQLLRVSATAKHLDSSVALEFYSVDASGKKIAEHAACTVTVTERQGWVEDWKRNTYLIESRLNLLRLSVDGGKAHKLKRGLAYKLFATLVEYSDHWQGMQEVILDSDALEATARVEFQVGASGFEFNPCWVDSLGAIAGFIMNGNDNACSDDQVFVNHGWEHMRCARPLEYGKVYRTYNRMQHLSGTMYGGDTYILEDGVVVALFEGVKFQGIPRRMIDLVLPKKGRPAPPAPATAVKKSSTAAPAKAPQTVAPKAPPSQASRPTQKIVVERLLQVMSEETGVALADLDQDCDLTDLGIDSLLTLTLSSRLQEELGLDVSFTDCATLTDVIARVGGSRFPSPASSVSPIASSNESIGSVDTEATSIDVEGDNQSIALMDSIREIVARETGLPLENLTPSSNLSEIGVDSLLSLTILSTVSEVLGIDLPPNLLADNETLAEVENTLVLNGFIECPEAKKAMATISTLPEPATQASETASARDVISKPPHATSVRLQGSAKTAQKTIFLFPDGAGSATSYTPLPDISPDIIVFGLNCPWLRTPEGLKCSLEDYVAKFLIEVRQRQPKGPYHFGGWSAGGILAYEAAQQLAKMGQKVERLLLLDSPDPVGLQNPPPRMYDFLESRDILGMEGKSPPKWLRPHMAGFINMLDNYKVKPFNETTPPPKTLLIYAKDGLCKLPDDPRPESRPDDPREMLWLLNNRTNFSGGGWLSLVGADNLQVDVIEEANHYTILASQAAASEVSRLIGSACR